MVIYIPFILKSIITTIQEYGLLRSHNIKMMKFLPSGVSISHLDCHPRVVYNTIIVICRKRRWNHGKTKPLPKDLFRTWIWQLCPLRNQGTRAGDTSCRRVWSNTADWLRKENPRAVRQADGDFPNHGHGNLWAGKVKNRRLPHRRQGAAHFWGELQALRWLCLEMLR